MSDLNLAGPTPVLYFDPDDDAMDGNGFNVLLANAAFVDRFPTLEKAVEAYKKLLTRSW